MLIVITPVPAGDPGLACSYRNLEALSALARDKRAGHESCRDAPGELIEDHRGGCPHAESAERPRDLPRRGCRPGKARADE